MDNLKTGDLILFNNQGGGLFGFFTSLIKWGTHSNYTHIGMILKDPHFIDNTLNGTFVWESTYDGEKDPQDGKIKLGVKLTPIDDALNTNRNIYIRKIICPDNTFNYDKLTEIHNIVYNKPYDIVPTDWIEALFRVDSKPQKTSRFWCSALVGYIYTKCGVLNENTDWSILRPSDFSLDGENLLFSDDNFNLENIESRIK